MLPYRTDSSFNSRRALSIEVGGKTLYTTALPDGFSEGVIDVPINASLIEQGFLAARIVYSGAITEDRCVDQRLSAAYLSFAGSGGLRAQFDGASLTRVASLAAAMPTAIDVDLPAGASAAQTAAALTLVAAEPNTVGPAVRTTRRALSAAGTPEESAETFYPSDAALQE